MQIRGISGWHKADSAVRDDCRTLRLTAASGNAVCLVRLQGGFDYPKLTMEKPAWQSYSYIVKIAFGSSNRAGLSLHWPDVTPS